MMNIATRINNEYKEMLLEDSCNNKLIDRVCASFLAICPILRYYKAPFQNLAVCILIVFFPFICYKLLTYFFSNNRIEHKNYFPILGLILFFIYRTFVHNISLINIVFNATLLIYFIAAFIGCINITNFIKTGAIIAFFASMIIIIQGILYYTFKYHLQVVPTSFFTSDASAWKLLAKTGTIGVTQIEGSLYRPSAFFMEPSHMFLYFFPQIFVLILDENHTRIKTSLGVLFSLGLVVSTSGMGIMTVVFVWTLFFVKKQCVCTNFKDIKFVSLIKNKKFQYKICVFLLLFIIFSQIPFIKSALLRVFDFSKGGAIAGRTRLAMSLIKRLSFVGIIFGANSNLIEKFINNATFNVPGFISTIFKYGIVGIVTSYWLYVYAIFNLKKQYFWIAFFVIVVSFFSAQTHGFVYLIYYSFFIFKGIHLMNSSDKRSYNRVGKVSNEKI